MQVIGILQSIGELENTNGPASYVKRPFFVKYLDSKNKEQLLKFVFYEPQLNVINNFQVEEKVKIDFDFKGLISQKTGKFFEEKVAIGISPYSEPGDKKNKNITNIPLTGKIRPDFSRSYDEFPEELIY